VAAFISISVAKQPPLTSTKPASFKLFRIRFYVVVTLIAAQLLTGCTSARDYIRNGFKVGPNYGRPPAAVAPDWLDAKDPRVRKDREDLSQWWAIFKDTNLDTLIQTAYRQNLTLREAGFRVLQARAQLGIAVGEFFPQSQTANGGFIHTQRSRQVENIPAAIPTTFSQWDLGFSLAWELDIWGQFRRAIEAADDNLDASVEGYDFVLVTLLADVATYYVQLRTLEQQLAYLRANVVLQRESLSIAQAQFKGGQVTELDPDQAQSLLSQTESEIPAVEAAIRQTANQLCILLGIPPEHLREKLGEAPIPKTPTDVAVGIPADLLRRRPDVRRDERLAAAQCAAIGIAEADFYPAVTILGTIGYSADQFGSLFNAKSFRGTIGPSFQWNILNYGRILNNVRQQDAKFQELVAHYQNTVLQANAEVENGLATFLNSQEQAKDLAQSVTAAEKAVKVAIAQYKGGQVDYNRVSTLEQNLVQYQSQLAQANGQIAQGLIQVYRALGGGWQIRCPEAQAAQAEPVVAPLPVQASTEIVPTAKWSVKKPRSPAP
jgi:NodT family efflux transporter outer membrane factor (OMF) lipoprotein